MYPKHHIYVIKIDETPVYIGYTSQPLEKRLKAHLWKAHNPNSTDKELAVIRGHNKIKDDLLSMAYFRGLDITIEAVETRYVYEPLDEQSWIDHYRNEGYDLVNDMRGNSGWQPYVLNEEDGTLTEVNKTETTVNIRESIQDWKRRSMDKAVAEKVNKPSKTKSKQQKEQDKAEAALRAHKTPEEIQAFIDSFGFNFSNHTLSDWQKGIYTK